VFYFSLFLYSYSNFSSSIRSKQGLRKVGVKCFLSLFKIGARDLLWIFLLNKNIDYVLVSDLN